jgi:hypothetical protein
MDSNRICLICPYFGKFPNYIDLVFRSCKMNPSIDWLLFTDCSNHGSIPDNVKIVRMSFDDFRDLVQKKFDFEVVIPDSYKLCDFKPTYGMVFEDILKPYGFWGHCDLDIIYGNIRRFCTDEILLKYNKIFTRGHLTIYRNTPKVNRYFMLPGENYDYKDVFSNLKNLCFDEMNGINKILRSNQIPQYQSEGVVADISWFQKKFMLSELIVNEQLFNYPEQVFYWEKGKTFRAYMDENTNIVKTEVVYIHLQKRNFPEIPFQVTDNLDSYFITPDGFYEKKGDVMIDDFKTYNKGDIWGKWPYYKYRLQSRIKSIKRKYKRRH